MQDQSQELPDKDFLIVALDLLSGICEGLKTSVESLIVNTNPSIFVMLVQCIKVSFSIKF